MSTPDQTVPDSPSAAPATAADDRPPSAGRSRPRPKPTPPGRVSSAITFGWRGMLKVRHVPEQLLDVTITPVMFVLMFTYLFGGAIAGSTSDYLDYLMPGVLAMSVVFTTVYSGVALNTDLTRGVVDRFRSLPIWRPAPLVGSLLGDSVRYLVAGTVIMIVGRDPGLPARRRHPGDPGSARPGRASSRSGSRGSSRRSACCCARRTR